MVEPNQGKSAERYSRQEKTWWSLQCTTVDHNNIIYYLPKKINLFFWFLYLTLHSHPLLFSFSYLQEDAIMGAKEDLEMDLEVLEISAEHSVGR